MSTAHHDPENPEAREAGALQLELYVAGDTLNSRRARENLDRILKQVGEPVTVKVVDVLKDSKAAFSRGIFATPSLVARAGARQSLIIGDLSDGEAVLKLLAGV